MASQILQEKNTLYAPKFVDSWDEQILYPLADWINGVAFKDFNFTPKGRPIIKIAEIKNGVGDQTRFTDGQYDEVYLLKKGDMLFCWSGQPETSIDVFWWDGPQGWLNQHIFKVIPKIENKFFFFYLLKYLKPNFIQIAINKQTTGLGHVTKGDLEKFVVRLPSDNEQRAIAAVLGSFDDKIELLREQNKTLEATAQAIFKEWFVNFNFPNEKGKPYKKSGGKMIDYELGEIPEGWRVGTVNDVITRFSITYRCDQNDLSPKGKTLILDQGTSGIYGFTERDPDFEASTENPVILFTNHTCNMWFINYPFCAIQNIIPFRGNAEYSTFFVFYMTLGQIKFIEYKGHWPDFEQKKYVIPKPEIANNFAKIIKPLQYKIWNNNSQIQTLLKLRDTLLPKLMSGKLRVKHHG